MQLATPLPLGAAGTGGADRPMQRPLDMCPVQHVLGRWEVQHGMCLDPGRAIRQDDLLRRDVALPVGAYGGRVGRLAETDVMGVLTGVKGLVASQGIASGDDYDRAAQIAKTDLNRFQCTLPFYIAYGQRPS